MHKKLVSELGKSNPDFNNIRSIILNGVKSWGFFGGSHSPAGIFKLDGEGNSFFHLAAKKGILPKVLPWFQNISAAVQREGQEYQGASSDRAFYQFQLKENPAGNTAFELALKSGSIVDYSAILGKLLAYKAKWADSLAQGLVSTLVGNFKDILKARADTTMEQSLGEESEEVPSEVAKLQADKTLCNTVTSIFLRNDWMLYATALDRKMIAVLGKVSVVLNYSNAYWKLSKEEIAAITGFKGAVEDAAFDTNLLQHLYSQVVSYYLTGNGAKLTLGALFPGLALSDTYKNVAVEKGLGDPDAESTFNWDDIGVKIGEFFLRGNYREGSKALPHAQPEVPASKVVVPVQEESSKASAHDIPVALRDTTNDQQAPAKSKPKAKKTKLQTATELAGAIKKAYLTSEDATRKAMVQSAKLALGKEGADNIVFFIMALDASIKEGPHDLRDTMFKYCARKAVKGVAFATSYQNFIESLLKESGGTSLENIKGRDVTIIDMATLHNLPDWAAISLTIGLEEGEHNSSSYSVFNPPIKLHKSDVFDALLEVFLGRMPVEQSNDFWWNILNLGRKYADIHVVEKYLESGCDVLKQAGDKGNTNGAGKYTLLNYYLNDLYTMLNYIRVTDEHYTKLKGDTSQEVKLATINSWFNLVTGREAKNSHEISALATKILQTSISKAQRLSEGAIRLLKVGKFHMPVVDDAVSDTDPQSQQLNKTLKSIRSVDQVAEQFEFLISSEGKTEMEQRLEGALNQVREFETSLTQEYAKLFPDGSYYGKAFSAIASCSDTDSQMTVMSHLSTMSDLQGGIAEFCQEVADLLGDDAQATA